MFKRIRSEPLAVLVLVLLIGVLALAAKPAGITQLTSLWIGDATDTADVTPGANDLFVSGTAEIDGAVRIDGALAVAGAITSTTTRSFDLNVAGGGVDGGYDLDESSTPDLSTCDGIPCLVWADSGETTAVGWTFRLPSDFSSGLVVYALVSSNGASGAGQILDWAAFVNTDDVGFASATAQTGVACTSATLNASNEVLTLTSNGTAEALYAAGTWVTLEFFNASTDDDDLELKGLTVTYTATN